MRFADLSHDIADGTPAYRGLPPARLLPLVTRERSREAYRGQSEFQIDNVSLTGNTGTYLDSPYHRYADGADLADLNLRVIADVRGIVFPIPKGMRCIKFAVVPFLPKDIRCVLFQTQWDRHWNSPEYYRDAPFLDARTAQALVQTAGIPIVEHLCHLQEAAPFVFRFFAVAPKCAA